MTRKTVRVRSPRLAPAKKPETLRSKKGVYERNDFIRSRVRDVMMVGLDQERVIRIEEAGRSLPVENLIGFMPVPVGVADHFVINGRKTFVPMATLERGVVAGASHAAKLCKPTGGFRVEVRENIACGQIMYPPMRRAKAVEAVRAIRLNGREIIAASRAEKSAMNERGGGLIELGLGARIVGDGDDWMVVVNYEADVKEAMGANAIIRIGHGILPALEKFAGRGRPTVICTNADHGPLLTAVSVWPVGPNGITRDVADRIVHLDTWARHDERRTTTHNKGVMNGVAAVCLATGQDVPAVFATILDYAASRPGATKPVIPLTQFEFIGSAEHLVGTFRTRIPLGTVGGATQIGAARTCRQIMGARSVRELAAVTAAAGLAANFASLRMLADEGVIGALERLDRK